MAAGQKHAWGPHSSAERPGHGGAGLLDGRCWDSQALQGPKAYGTACNS